MLWWCLCWPWTWPQPANVGDNKNYVAGDGTVSEYGADDRLAPVQFTGMLYDDSHVDFAGAGVTFSGVNIRDEKGTAMAFERNFKLSHPSIADKDGGVLLALAALVAPTSVPTTLVLDKQGRVAARIVGVAQKGTLKDLVTSALAEE
ncbi:TlpA family protein disulfide reductase [Arthrobacter sp. TMN-49]